MQKGVKQDKILSMLGLAQRAGKIKSGNFTVEQSVKGGKSQLVVIAGDTSEASKKNLRDMCSYYETDCVEYSAKESLGHALGKEFRSVVSVEDAGFAKKIKTLLEGDIKGGSATDGKDQ